MKLVTIYTLIASFLAVNAIPTIRVPSRDLEPPPKEEDAFEKPCALGLAFHNETGDCFFLEGSEPCGKNMIFVSDEDEPAYGVCVCKYGRKSDCIAKPVVYWDKTNACYPLFEQGPCNETEWLIAGKDGQPECVKSTCTVIIPPEVTIPSQTFVFANNGSCYETNEKAFCDEGEMAVFLGKNYEPQCLPLNTDKDFCYPSELQVASLQGPKFLTD